MSKIFFYGLLKRVRSMMAAGLSLVGSGLVGLCAPWLPLAQPRRAVVCLFGVIPRSVRRTWPTIEGRLVLPLRRAGFDVRIYVFLLDVGDVEVDGVRVDRADADIVPHDYFESRDQLSLDVEIDEKCRGFESPIFRPNYTPAITRNALRQLYSEQRVGAFLKKHGDDFDVAIMCGPDYLLARPISVAHVRRAFWRNAIYTSRVNDAEGYTNGFYFGRPDLLSKVLFRFDELDHYRHLQRDYERVLQAAFERHEVKRRTTDMVFFKVRADGRVEWQGGMKTHFLSRRDRSSVERIYALATEGRFAETADPALD